MNPLKTEAIKKFLQASTHADLAELYSLNMEVQVNVCQDGGSLVEGVYEGRQWRAWTDGITQWKSFRIPINANSEPHYEDRPLNFDLASHAEGIGMTGWDWKEKLSRWVAFDFDAILGHSDKHSRKLTDDELHGIENIIRDIPWVGLRKSTGGKGLHLYVSLVPVPTANHTEHAALARAILGSLSALTGYDFASKVDICGGNMWVWHRKMRGTDGLVNIKTGKPLVDIPPNWRDHIAVTSGKRKKNLPSFIQEVTDPDVFEELTGRRTKIPLDEHHKKLIKWLGDNHSAWWWDNDHYMLIAHTYDLKRAHTDLKLKGIFTTLAEGSEHGVDHNCFLFPLRGGAWAVRRYTPGVAEANTWEQDGSGWTRCFYNRDPDLAIACRTNDGLEHPTGGYDFRHAKSTVESLNLLGANITIPTPALLRPAKVKAAKADNKVVVEFDAEKSDGDSFRADGWILEKKKWRRVVNISVSAQGEPETNFNYDDLVRHLVTPTGENYGWSIRSEGSWRYEPLDHVKSALLSCNFSPKEVVQIIGSGVFKAWTVVNIPFGPEYPGDRKWNRDSAQLRFPLKTERPSSNDFPTWKRILDHVGDNLNDYVAQDSWCRSNAIVTGADYLMCWIASMFKEPGEPLPYIFLYGPQGSGKSILHEGLSLLIRNGVVRADTALASNSSFNGELEHAVLCVIEETDLRRNVSAYNRIKDWVTSRQLLIHRKQRTPYSVDNTTHYIQCANEANACPIFPGDTRITMIYVDRLPGEQIPKKEMVKRLEKEASAFLTHIMNIELPISNDRLNVPVVITNEKLLAEESNKSLLELFLDEHCRYCRGHKIEYNHLWERFSQWLDPSYSNKWTKVRMGRELPVQYPKGRGEQNIMFIGNISLEADPQPLNFRYICKEGKLIRHDESSGDSERKTGNQAQDSGGSVQAVPGNG